MVMVVKDLAAGYGGGVVVHGVNMEVRNGECIALLGRNGAGKTTLLRAISGLMPLYRGQIEFLGKRIETMRPAQRAANGLVQILESKGIFHDQTVLDNLILGAHRQKRDAYMTEIENRIYPIFPILREKAGRMASTLSGGEQQMLAIGRALVTKPKLLMLDEPSLGLAPLLVREVFRIIRSLKEEGVTTLLVEQMATQALKMADRAYVLVNGCIKASGTGEELAGLDNIMSLLAM